MEVTMQDVLARIEQADDAEINEIMAAVRRRYAAAFPDWEVVYIACPRENIPERRRMVDYYLNLDK